jgi:hypothetical protein
MLACDLSSCHASISSLKNINDDLNAIMKKLNVSSSSLEYVSIYTRCKDQLNVELKTCKHDVEKVKFARDAFTIGRHPFIKDGLGFHVGAKDTKSHKAHNFTK